MEEMDLRWQMSMLTMRARRKWSATTATRGDILLGSAELQETKTTSTRKPQEENEQILKDLKKSELMVLGYKTGLKSVEERLEFFKTNESIYLEDIKVFKVEIQMKDIAIRELRKKLKIAQKEKDVIQLSVEKFENASKDKFVSKPVVENYKAKSSKEETKKVKENNDALIIEE
uniref:Uncharacterized protein n=1 Tax=Tanacetum cinerariifolium TaxID=118510 RepID=A0A699KPB4_TANCI|nr:hypothetical protein [Tanacetum cinerariifolium]